MATTTSIQKQKAKRPMKKPSPVKKSATVKTRKAKAISKTWGGEVGDRLSALFERKLPDGTPLVPSEGDASTDLGQLVRGMNRIMYRYYNDGDIIGIGYGKESLDWVVDYMQNSANATISNALDSLYGKYSKFDINFEDMDEYELEDYVNEALGTNFESRYDYGDEIEEPEEPNRDDFDSDEEYEEAMSEYEAEMEDYKHEVEEYQENRENFDYYMDNPGSFEADYGSDYVEDAIERAESAGYEQDMIDLGKLVADYVERELIQRYELDESYANETDIYAPDTYETWEDYEASSKKMRKNGQPRPKTFNDMVKSIRTKNNQHRRKV